MLAKVGSGAGGIKEYLEEGKKKGREYDRDLIDDRIPLEGDIDLMDSTIKSIQTRQEGDARYLHISLSFAEDFTHNEEVKEGQINIETIKKVVEQYRNDLMAGYEKEEYIFYAEAHIPKVSHDIHAETGESIKRLPHVHIVIPTKNIESGSYLNPLGYGSFNLEYHDAIQEKINHDFRLKSPDDSPRDTPNKNPLVRHTVERPQPTTAKEMRELVKNIIDEEGVATLSQLSEKIKKYGEVKTRKGKEGDYLNIKIEGQKRGINLREYTQQTLENKEALLEKNNKRFYGVATKTESEYVELVDHWKERRALEVRFVSSKARREVYKEMTPLEKIEWLEQRKDGVKTRILEKINRSLYDDKRTGSREDGADKPNNDRGHQSEYGDRTVNSEDAKPTGDTNQRSARITQPDTKGAERNSRKPKGDISYGSEEYRGYKPRITKVRSNPPPNRIHRLSDLSELSMVRIDNEPEMLLQGDVSSDVGFKETPANTGLRWANNGARGTGELNLEQKQLTKRIRDIGKDQVVSLSAVLQSKAIIESIAKDRKQLDPIALSERRIKSALVADKERLNNNARNLKKQKTVSSSLRLDKENVITDYRLKADTNAFLVLQAAEKTYGIDLNNYSVGAGRDGTPRIFHDNKQYNLGDFFTKHLDKSWNEAKEVLTQCYKETLSDSLPTPDKALWVAFNSWRSQGYKQRVEDRETLKKSLREETLNARKHYQEQKKEAYKSKGVIRHKLLAEARANRIDTLAQIAKERKEGYENLKPMGRNAEYRTFLMSLAEKGDISAIGELRRIAKIMPDAGKDFASGDDDKVKIVLPHYTIDPKGNIVYKDNNQSIIKDSLKGVEVLETSDKTYDLALKVAVSRYGTTLNLNGDKLFKEKMIAAAERSGMKLLIRDKDNRFKAPIKVNHNEKER